MKEVVEPCIDLASAIGGGTGNAAKVISEPRRELCGIETTAPGAGTMVSEFSEDDECNASAKRRGKTEVMAEPTCVAAARVQREIDEAHGPRTCRHSTNWWNGGIDITASHQSSSESCSHFLPLCREKTQRSDANQAETAAKPKELNAVKTVVIVHTIEF